MSGQLHHLSKQTNLQIELARATGAWHVLRSSSAATATILESEFYTFTCSLVLSSYLGESEPEAMLASASELEIGSAG
jgi:hypothetical protein